MNIFYTSFVPKEDIDTRAFCFIEDFIVKIYDRVCRIEPFDCIVNENSGGGP